MATNTLENTDLVTKFAVEEFKNALQMGAKVDRQMDTQFARKVGDTINIRRPVMFEAVDGPVVTVNQDIEEGLVSVVMDTHKTVRFAITSTELTLNIEEANERYIKPAMIELAQKVESKLAATKDFIFNFVGTPGTEPSNFLDVANADAVLDEIGVPMDQNRSAFYTPRATVNLANGLQNVFPTDIAKTAIEKAMIGSYGGFDLFKNQSLVSHTVGNFSGSPVVDGAGQNVTYLTSKNTGTQTIILDGFNDSSGDPVLRAGDVITFGVLGVDGVNSVNRRTREDTGQLAQFVVVADTIASTGPTDDIPVTISDAIIIDGPYKTVTVAPADDSVVNILTGLANSIHKQNLAWHRNAITLAFARLDVPADGVSTSQSSMDDVSITTTRQFQFGEFENAFRFDTLFAVKVQNPGWAVRTTS